MESTSFGRYQLLGLLGKGGMGDVWRAHDTVTNRVVALKVLAAPLADDEKFVQRFKREAQAVNRVSNPHLVPIHNSGEIGGRLYIDMRLIEGGDLRAALAPGPMETVRAVRIIGEVAGALHAAHKVGVVHRDVKPSNILLDEDDFAYLIDFGLARTADEAKLTNTRAIVGTWAYLAPERMLANQLDARSDVYALACVLHECLTGARPFPGDSVESQVAQHLTTRPPRPSIGRSDLSPAFDEVIAKGMAKEPGDRYQTTLELARAAHDIITAPRLRSAHTRPVVAAHEGVPPPLDPKTVAHARPLLPPRHISTPAARLDPATVAIQRPPLPSAQPSRRWWRRKPVVVTAAAAAVCVVGVAAIVLTLGGTEDGRQTTLPFAGLEYLGGAAVDANGNVYVANRSSVAALTDSLEQTELPLLGPTFVDGLAVDGTGNVYLSDWSNGELLRLAAGGTTPTRISFPEPLRYPDGVAVGDDGTVYVADYGGRSVWSVPAGPGIPSKMAFEVKSPRGVAVDGDGTVYVTDTYEGRVVKLVRGGHQETLDFTSLHQPIGVAVDGSGNVYVADTGNSRVLMLPPASTTQTELPFTGLNQPVGVAVDARGTVYVSDSGNNRVVKLAAK